MAPWSPEQLKEAVDDVLQLVEPGKITTFTWIKISDVLDQWFISDKTDAHRAVLQPLLNDIGFGNLDLTDDEVVRQNMDEQCAAARERENMPPVSPMLAPKQHSLINTPASHQESSTGQNPVTERSDIRNIVGYTTEPSAAAHTLKGLPIFYLGESNMIFTSGARLYHLLRNVVAAIDEGSICGSASVHKHFVRAPELARIDCGIFVSQSTPDIPDLTDRFFYYFDAYGTSKSEKTIPVEIKSLVPRPTTHDHEKLHTIKRFCYNVKFRPEQFSQCEWVFFTSIADPTVVAAFPMHNLRMITNVEEGGNRVYQFPRMSLDMVYATALPPELMWAEMPRDMLPEFIEGVRQFALGATQQFINPFSKVSYRNLPAMKASPFSVLLTHEGVNEKELLLRRKIWHAFKVHGSAAQLKVKLPDSAPFTSDLEIVHSSGVSVLIELKQGVCKVSKIRGGRIRLSHRARNVGIGRAMFTEKKRALGSAQDRPPVFQV